MDATEIDLKLGECRRRLSIAACARDAAKDKAAECIGHLLRQSDLWAKDVQTHMDWNTVHELVQCLIAAASQDSEGRHLDREMADLHQARLALMKG